MAENLEGPAAGPMVTQKHFNWYRRQGRASRIAAALLLLSLAAAGAWGWRQICDRREITSRTWRIGFHQTKPFVSPGPDGQPTGFAVEVFTEAARRAGVRLTWVFVPQGALAAFGAHQIDLFPRSTNVRGLGRAPYISNAWFESFYGMVAKDAAADTSPSGLRGKRVAIGPTPFVTAFAGRVLSGSSLVVKPGWEAVLAGVCADDVAAGFVELREATTALIVRHSDCGGTALKLWPIRGAVVDAGIGSTLQARPVADALREAISDMAESGQLAEMHAHWYLPTPNEVTFVNEVQRSRASHRTLMIFLVVLGVLLACATVLILRMRLLRAQALAASATKDAFLAAMSHEIRTPMNAILGMSDMLWESDLAAEQRYYVDIFRRAGANLLALINDLLDLSKIEAGHAELEEVPFDLEEVIDNAVDLVRFKAQSRGLVLLSRIAPDVAPRLVGDPNKLRQVLINLLGNAVKFTDTGEVMLSVRRTGGDSTVELEFSVSDTGIGIPQSKLESIFDAFTQADSTTTRKYGGTGLGLNISRHLVELMHGRLTAASVEGEGSVFRFQARFAASPKGAGRAPEVEDFHGRRVLIMDDNPTNRLILRETLSAWGFECSEFLEPEAALISLRTAKASAKPYALALLDKKIRQVDGIDVALRIHAVQSDLPLILLTSDMRPGDAARCRDAGVAGYAVKPVKRAELFRLVCQAVNPPAPVAHPAKPPARTEERAADSGALRILVAEDSPDNRLLIEAYLKSTRHSLTFAEDGKIAVERFAQSSFDLILMDIQMPEMDGITATRAIRKMETQRGGAATPIVALSANARPQDVEASRAAGCNSHLSKPISKQRLLDALREYSGSVAPPAPIHIQAPAGLEDLMPDYLSARRQDAHTLTTLLQAQEYLHIESLGHKMKGSGASYGFRQLSEFGAAIEVSARQADQTALRRQAAQLEQYLLRVQI